jgi:hypothetical protein
MTVRQIFEVSDDLPLNTVGHQRPRSLMNSRLRYSASAFSGVNSRVKLIYPRPGLTPGTVLDADAWVTKSQVTFEMSNTCIY